MGITKERAVAILDECVDQEKLVKLFGAELILPELDKVIAKIRSGEIDLIPNTSIDNNLVAEGLENLKKHLGLA